MSIIFTSPSLNDRDIRKWKDLSSSLSNYFYVLHQREQLRKFEQFLHTPFFHKKPGDLQKLYANLRGKYHAWQETKVRIADLLNLLYDRNLYEKDGKKLARLINSLPPEIERFLAHVELDETKHNISMLATEAIRDKGHSACYVETVKRWKNLVKKLPLGREKYMHCWAAFHAGYFSIDVAKTGPKVGDFDTAYQHYRTLSGYLENLYDYEVESRVKILKYKRPGEWEADALVKVIDQAGALQKMANATFADYQLFKDNFLRIYAGIAASEQYTFYIACHNVLMDLSRRNPGPKIQWEQYQWCRNLISKKLYRDWDSVTKDCYLNNLHHTYQYEDFDLATQLTEALAPLVSDDDPEWCKYLADTARDFYRHRYTAVAKSIPTTHRRAGKDKHSDQFRLKSFQLRACLCLFAREYGWYDATDKAQKDMEAQANRYAEDMGQLRSAQIDNFCRVTSKILKAVRNDDLANQIISLRKEVITAAYIHSREWLLNYLEQVDPSRGELLSVIQPRPLVQR